MSLKQHNLENHRQSVTNEPIAQNVAISSKSIPLNLQTSHSRRRGRPSPYPQPQHSLHQLNITYLDPATIEELIEIVRPRSPRHTLAAVLEPPPRGLHDQELGVDGDLEHRPVRRVLAMIIDFMGALKRAILGV